MPTLICCPNNADIAHNSFGTSFLGNGLWDKEDNQYLHFINILFFSVKLNIFVPFVHTCLQITLSFFKKDEN